MLGSKKITMDKIWNNVKAYEPSGDKFSLPIDVYHLLITFHFPLYLESPKEMEERKGMRFQTCDSMSYKPIIVRHLPVNTRRKRRQKNSSTVYLLVQTISSSQQFFCTSLISKFSFLILIIYSGN